MKRTLFVMALAFVVAAPMALAAGKKADKNPVVNLTGLVNPGLWHTSGELVRDGKTTPMPDSGDNNTCINAAHLKDILNSDDDDQSMKVKSYSLHGNHLHVEGVRAGQHGQMTMVMDQYYDDPDHNHGTIEMNGAVTYGGKKHTIAETIKMKSHRVSATCPKGSED